MVKIEHAIRTFEPRLDPQSVRVEFAGDSGEHGLKKRLRVHAVLRIHPFHSPITFDTHIDASTQEVTVKENDG